MVDEYAMDTYFKDVMSAIALGKKKEPFYVKDGYLLYGNRATRLCTNPMLLHMRDIHEFKLRSREQNCSSIGQP